MYTMSPGYKRKSRFADALTLITAISIALCLICLSIKLIIGAKFLYYYDINHLKITETVNMSESVLKDNYNKLMSYLLNNNIKDLSLPDFPMSPHGKTHFEEVKILFNFNNYILYGTLLISVLGIIASLMKGKIKTFKFASISLIIIPIILAIPFAVDFNGAFTVFHKLTFNNDYWLFDPDTDPIINALPESYFMHCAIGILLLITVFSLVLYGIYRLLKRRQSSW